MAGAAIFLGAGAWGCTSILGDFGTSGDAAIDSGVDAPIDAPSPDAATRDAASADSGDAAASSDATDAPACDGGQTFCGSGCVDTTISASNCGACGNDCGGGTCSASHCSPVTITSGLATTPYGVAVGGGQVFWARSGAVEKCAVTGCTGSGAASVNTDSTLTNAGLVGGGTIVTDGNTVAWLAGDPNTSSTGYPGPVIYSCPAGGCMGGFPPKLGSANVTFTQLALAGGQLFVNIDDTGGAIRTCPLSSCQGDPLTTSLAGAHAEGGFGLASDGTTLFYFAGNDPTGGGNGVHACALAGCPSGSTQLFPGGNAVAVNGDTVFASTSTGTIVACAKAGCGGSPTTIVPSVTGIQSMTADATHLYYSVQGSSTAATGQIAVCSLPGCTGGPTVLADTQAQPVSMVLGSDGFIYWANAGVSGVPSSIVRLRP
jgi:hypothetical protein